MVEGQVKISEFFAGKPVVFCHNPTAMEHEDDLKGYWKDLTQASQQKLGRITAEVDNLVKHLKESVAAVGKRGCVVHIAHSQGALITFLAAKQLSESDMKQIEVLAFGGAAAIRKTPATPFKRCINYYAVNDPLLMVVPSAAQALRSGMVVGEGEFCFLAPRCGDPILDHDLCGPTYAQALQWEGDRFQRMYVSRVYRSCRAVYLLLSAILDAISIRLNAAFKMLIRPIMLWCLMSYHVTRHLAVRLRGLASDKVLRPVILFIQLVIEWAKVNVRAWRGEEKYEPVSSLLIED